VIASRRPLGARHEFRLGTRELVVLGVLAALVSGLTFALGVVVGRETGTRPRLAAAPVVETPPPSHEQGGKPTPARADEKLTFYRTLTAPTTDLGGAAAPPVIEERLVPREEPAATADDEAARAKSRPRPAPPPPTAARGRLAAAPRPAATPSRPTQVAAAPAPSAAAIAPQVPQGAPGPGEPQLWTIQVSSFRSKALAEELRARLQTRGLDAYLLSAATEEGRVRYRVRVGAYQSRSEAERVAGELRSERTLSPFVTLRAR
jgi:cell division septation protein DedD